MGCICAPGTTSFCTPTNKKPRARPAFFSPGKALTPMTKALIHVLAWLCMLGWDVRYRRANAAGLTPKESC